MVWITAPLDQILAKYVHLLTAVEKKRQDVIVVATSAWIELYIMILEGYGRIDVRSVLGVLRSLIRCGIRASLIITIEFDGFGS